VTRDLLVLGARFAAFWVVYFTIYWWAYPAMLEQEHGAEKAIAILCAWFAAEYIAEWGMKK
jgi:hypothetical protein